MGNYKVLGFPGMLNCGAGEFIKPITELAACKNMYQDKYGVLKRCPGVANWNFLNSPLSGKVTFLHYFPGVDGLKSARMYAGSSDIGVPFEIKYIHQTGGSSLTGTNPYSSFANIFPKAVNYLGKVFVVGGYAGGGAVNSVINELAISTTDSDITNMPKAKFITTYRGLIYIGHIHDTTIFPNVPYSSNSHVCYCDDPVSGAIGWTEKQTRLLDCGQNDGGEITGMFVMNDKLYIIKSNGIWSWDEDVLEKVSGVGSNFPESIKMINGVIYFTNYDGIWRFIGDQPVLISKKVQKFIDQLYINAGRSEDNLMHGCGLSLGFTYGVFVGDATIEGERYDNAWIMFDTTTETFYIRCTPTGGYTSIELSDGAFYGTTSGKIIQFRRGSNYTDDDGNTIHYFAKTNVLDLDTPHKTKYSPKITIFSKNPNGVKVAIDTNNSGSFEEGMSQVIDKNVFEYEPSIEFNIVQLKFYGESQTGTGQTEIEGFVIESNEID